MKVKKIFFLIIKIIIIAGIFTWLLGKVDLNDIKKVIHTISYPAMIVALLLALLNRFITSYKWLLLLKHHGTDVKYFDVIKIVFMSQFLGAMIPSGIGVDAVRFLKIQKHKKNLTASLGSIVCDRMLAVFAMAVLCIFAVIFSWNILHVKKLLLIVLLIAVCIIAAVLFIMSSLPLKVMDKIKMVFGIKMVSGNSDSIKGIVIKKITDLSIRLLEIHDLFKQLFEQRKKFAALCILNLCVQFFRIMQIHFLFMSVNYPIHLGFEMSVVPMIIFLTLLPLSFSGLGIKEGAFVYFFSLIKVPVSVSLCVSLLSYFLLLVGVVPGALFFLFEKKTVNKVMHELESEQLQKDS